MVDEQFSLLASDFQNQQSERVAVIEDLESELETDFPRLQDCLKAGALEREEQDGLILKRIAEETETVVSKVKEVKKGREIEEEKVLELLKGMVDSIK